MRFCIILILLIGSRNNSSAEKSNEPLLITNVAQLTFEGNRSGEGYFRNLKIKFVFKQKTIPGTLSIKFMFWIFSMGKQNWFQMEMVRQLVRGLGPLRIKFFMHLHIVTQKHLRSKRKNLNSGSPEKIENIIGIMIQAMTYLSKT